MLLPRAHKELVGRRRHRERLLDLVAEQQGEAEVLLLVLEGEGGGEALLDHVRPFQREEGTRHGSKAEHLDHLVLVQARLRRERGERGRVAGSTSAGEAGGGVGVGSRAVRRAKKGSSHLLGEAEAFSEGGGHRTHDHVDHELHLGALPRLTEEQVGFAHHLERALGVVEQGAVAAAQKDEGASLCGALGSCRP